METSINQVQNQEASPVIQTHLDKLLRLADKYDSSKVDNSEILFKLAKYSQQLAIECRSLYGNILTPDYNAEAKENLHDLGYSFEHNGQAIHLTLPLLMPIRGSNSGYITEPLCELLSLYAREVPRFTNCTVIFRHIYAGGRNIRDIRDHDNIECRAVLNVIERYLLTSDSGYYCANIHATEYGVENRTVITLLPGRLNVGVLRKAVDA